MHSLAPVAYSAASRESETDSRYHDHAHHQRYACLCSQEDGGMCRFLGNYTSADGKMVFDLYIHTGGKHPSIQVRWDDAGGEEGVPTTLYQVPSYVRDSRVADAIRAAKIRARGLGLI